MKEICKNCLHYSSRPEMCGWGACFRFGGVAEVEETGHCPRWELTEEPQPLKWKRLHEDFDREEDCTILVPRFYDKHCGRLSGKVSETTVYIYKAVSGEFYCPYEYPIEYIPFDLMFNEWYINLDEIAKPWENSN